MTEFQQMTSRDLVRESDRCIKQGGDSLIQRALKCLNVVATRYSNNPDNRECRENAAYVMRQLGNIYMIYSIDHRAAYKNLMLARQIAEEDDNYRELAQIYVSLANLYHVNVDENNYDRLSKLTAEAIQKAYEAALKANDYDILSSIVGNMLLLSIEGQMPDQCTQAILKLKGQNPKMLTNKGKAILILIDSFEAYWKGDRNKALALIEKARPYIKSYVNFERHLYILDYISIKILVENGEQNRAIDIAKSALKRASSGGHPDYELTFYGELSNLYENIGDKDSMNKYNFKYLQLQNQQEKSSNLHSVETLSFMTEIEEINHEVEKMSAENMRHKHVRTILICGLVIMLIFSSFLLYIHLHLKRSHRRLYESSEEMRRINERYSALRHELENNLENLQEENKQLREKFHKDDSSVNDNIEITKEKHDDDDLMPLYSRIISIMDKDASIYSPDYSLALLSSKVGMPQRVVSRAINELHGCNFRQLLNEYRIRKACELMHLPAKDTFTIESIANEVGIRSRTSFATLFKKSIGLTPTEYWRIAKENRK